MFILSLLVNLMLNISILFQKKNIYYCLLNNVVTPNVEYSSEWNTLYIKDTLFD